ncbi:MAG: FecR domain-containing protein [Puia sp.]
MAGLPEFIQDFLERFADGGHTEEEHEQFIYWLRTATPEELELGAERYREIAEKKSPAETKNRRLVDTIEAAIDAREMGQSKMIPLYRRIWFRVAAAVFIILLSGSVWYIQSRKAVVSAVLATNNAKLLNDVAPGGNLAILVMDGGRQVKLGDARRQTITEKNGNQISDQNGLLSYGIGQTSTGTEIYNTIVVPRKGQYQVQLSDGTKVWLNAESTLTYPVVFTDKDRRVVVTGEAYFEVARDPSRPFHVRQGNLDVQVLGTHFNVNSYQDEKQVKVTLLQGAVRLTSSERDSKVTLKPGMQGLVMPGGKLTVTDKVDVNGIIGWTQGEFRFRDADLKSILRQLVRWYDVQVQFRGNTVDRLFTGDMSRNKNLSAVLKVLEMSNIHCSLENNILIVTP